MGRPRDLRFAAIGWMIIGILSAGAGDKEWMAIGIILSWLCYLAAAINAKIDALALPAFNLSGAWPSPAKPKKDLA